ncbi:unnamed protein product, partial [Didymodactylos carnosus]
MTGVSEEARASIPDLHHVKRNIQRARITVDSAPVPLDLYFDRIPYNLIITKRNDNFLCFDSGPGADRIIIFS